MPPFVPRKRRTPPPPPLQERPAKRKAVQRKNRSSVFADIDTTTTNTETDRTSTDNQAFLEALGSGESSSSDDSSDEYEDVLPGPSRTQNAEKSDSRLDNDSGDDDDDNDDMEWEDAIPLSAHSEPSHLPDQDEAHNRSALELTLSKPDDIPMSLTQAAGGGKKGPTKIERFIRLQTHCVHVQYLMWHNAIRNSWLNDKKVHELLVGGLSDGLKQEVERWRRASALDVDGQKVVGDEKKTSKPKQKGTKKGKATVAAKEIQDRDWGATAARLEAGVPDMSRGDPIVRLLKYLSAYWKKRFRVTTSSLRKLGYRSIPEVEKEIRAFKKNPDDTSRFGECISSLEDFRQLAKKCEGSRDLSAQLFTALLRGLGIEARMVASLQPLGFGWTKAEEAKPRKKGPTEENPRSNPVVATDSPAKSSEKSEQRNRIGLNSQKPLKAAKKISNSTKKTKALTSGTTSAAPIVLDDSSSDLSEPPTDSESELSLLENITTKKSNSTAREGIDRDLHFPVYWTEALSPITNVFHPVSTQLTPAVVSAPEHLNAFEPRGAAAEKAKQIICYVVAFSSDGTAKDITVRYLKRRQWPGKTKGFRLPPEKLPIYNKRGKILKYEELDWFKRLMSCYVRPSNRRTIADDLEDQGDLVIVKPSKENKSSSAPETLQSYKTSAEFVLERHLRREEALTPSAEHVKYFTAGKGEKATKEPVYRRKDVVSCKTVESWHKEGREPRIGEQPLKHVPIRAVTLLRKREVQEAIRDTGEKPLQGLYSRDQTDWIIPPPIENGKIPRNVYGNIDVYVPSMVPQGAIHIPLRGTVKICKRLEMDYAEACTGFEFGSNMAVPIIIGVVVAEENGQLLVDAWKEEERRKRKVEEGKREKMLLELWRKFAIGLKIVERVKAEYHTEDGDIPDEANPFTRKKPIDEFPLGDDEDHESGGGFLTSEWDNVGVAGGGFLLDNEDEEQPAATEMEILDEDDNSDQNGIPKMRTRASRQMEKSGPISLRSSHHHKSEAQGELNDSDAEEYEEHEEDNDEDDDDDDDEDEDDEDDDEEETYVPVRNRRGPTRQKESRAPANRSNSSRKTAPDSPYFKKH